MNSISGNMTASTISNWYWTPDLRIVRHVAQPDGISQVDQPFCPLPPASCLLQECSDVAYLEAEKEKLEKKRQEWVEGAQSATQPSLKLYFEQLLSEVDYQLEYVNQRLSELRKPAELLGGKSDSDQIPPSKMTGSQKLLGGMDDNQDSDQIPPSKNPPSRRRKGQGTGYIYWRTVRRGAKTYQQAYYHYEVYQEGDRLIKKSRYIPRRLLARVEKLEAEKAPVREILEVLGIKG